MFVLCPYCDMCIEIVEINCDFYLKDFWDIM